MMLQVPFPVPDQCELRDMADWELHLQIVW